MKTQAQDFILLSEQKQFGEVHIQKQVFNMIAINACDEVENVELIERRGEKDIHTKIVENDLIIDLSVKVLYGQNVNDVTMSVQEKIAQNIEYMTGFKCSRINIKVDGFYFSAQ